MFLGIIIYYSYNSYSKMNYSAPSSDINPVSDPVMLKANSTVPGRATVASEALSAAVLQATGPAEGVVGVAGGAAGSGLRAEGGAEQCPAGTDASGGGTQQPEGNQPEPGPQQRSPHQPVPGITQMLSHTHREREKKTTH